MIIMYPPESSGVPFKRYVFKNGREAILNKDAGTMIAIDENEARELEGEGWKRRVDKTMSGTDLRKVIESEVRRGVVAMPSRMTRDRDIREQARLAELRHFGKATTEPDRRIVVGDVNLDGVHGRVHVEHDQGADEIIVEGVATGLGESVDADLASAFRSSTASFLDAMQDSAEQTTAKTIIASVVAAILRRHSNLSDAVLAQKVRQRRA